MSTTCQTVTSPKTSLYRELARGKRPTRRLQLRYCNVMKLDMNEGCRHQQSPGRARQATGPSGENRWPNTSIKGRRNWHKLPQRNRKQSDSLNRLEAEHRCSLCKGQSLPHWPLQTQTPVLQPSRQLGCYPWSTLNDGGHVFWIFLFLNFFGQILFCTAVHADIVGMCIIM